MTNQSHPNDTHDSFQNVRLDRLSWTWLLIGFLLLPFTTIQTVIPLAAWLAPMFLLRFVRTSARARTALLLIFAAYALGIFIALRGSGTSDIAVYVLGIITFPIIRGLMYTLPYAADRLIGSRLNSWARVLVFPLAFASVDWLMSLSKIINSTGSPAYSQYDSLALIQILSITGMWGITFLFSLVCFHHECVVGNQLRLAPCPQSYSGLYCCDISYFRIWKHKIELLSTLLGKY